MENFHDIFFYLCYSSCLTAWSDGATWSCITFFSRRTNRTIVTKLTGFTNRTDWTDWATFARLTWSTSFSRFSGFPLATRVTLWTNVARSTDLTINTWYTSIASLPCLASYTWEPRLTLILICNITRKTHFVYLLDRRGLLDLPHRLSQVDQQSLDHPVDQQLQDFLLFLVLLFDQLGHCRQVDQVCLFHLWIDFKQNINPLFLMRHCKNAET